MLEHIYLNDGHILRPCRNTYADGPAGYQLITDFVLALFTMKPTPCWCLDSSPLYQSFIISIPKKGNHRLCQNYITISLISHPSKVMLRILPNRIKGKVEGILAEKQAGFPKRNTVEQIFIIRLLIKKHLQHQRVLYRNFIHFKTVASHEEL